MKQYIGISRDHSRSMFSITRPAARDYNNCIATIKQQAKNNNIDTIVNVVKCGVGVKAVVEREIINSNVLQLHAINEDHYIADGYATPLFDSIGELIELMSNTPDYLDPEVSFLVMIITDGEENSSKKYRAADLAEQIRRLQATDRWTFVFRVPRHGARSLERFGIHPGNILEWDQTERGIEAATQATSVAFATYYDRRSKGETSTTRFYADLSALQPAQVKANLLEISTGLSCLHVPAHAHRAEIREFVVTETGRYLPGSAYYQLTKTEKVQEAKRLIIQDQSTLKYYTGNAARQMLGFPEYGQITVSPHRLGNYKLFIQSTSTNRKLMGETSLLIYS